MNDILLIEAFVRAVYPILSLIAWVMVYRHGRIVNRKLKGIGEKQDGIEIRTNGRLDELIAAKEAIAYKNGTEVGIAETIVAAAIVKAKT